MTSYVLWMDHDHAKVYQLDVETPVAQLDRIERPHHYFQDIAHALRSAKEVLVLGPGTAKTQFMHYIGTQKDHHLAQSVVGVETIDHPTPAQVMATARKFFHARHQLEGTEARH